MQLQNYSLRARGYSPVWGGRCSGRTRTAADGAQSVTECPSMLQTDNYGLGSVKSVFT